MKAVSCFFNPFELSDVSRSYRHSNRGEFHSMVSDIDTLALFRFFYSKANNWDYSSPSGRLNFFDFSFLPVRGDFWLVNFYMAILIFILIFRTWIYQFTANLILL